MENSFTFFKNLLLLRKYRIDFGTNGTLCACVTFLALFTLPHFLQPSKKSVWGEFLTYIFGFLTFAQKLPSQAALPKFFDTKNYCLQMSRFRFRRRVVLSSPSLVATPNFSHKKLWLSQKTNFHFFLFLEIFFSKTTLRKQSFWFQWVERVVGSPPNKRLRICFFTQKYGPRKSQCFDFLSVVLKLFDSRKQLNLISRV